MLSVISTFQIVYLECRRTSRNELKCEKRIFLFLEIHIFQKIAFKHRMASRNV